MLQELSADQARQIADLAKAARAARDAILHNVPEQVLGVPRPARGEVGWSFRRPLRRRREARVFTLFSSME